MRRLWTVIALLAFGSALLPVRSAFAGYGAIAWDAGSGQRGWSWNQPTAKKAAEIALSECGASGCKIVIHTDAGRCAALATTQDGKAAGGAARGTKDEARLAALAGCQKRNAGECIVRVSDCNK
jgi:serine/threonine-protein kinase